MSKKWTKEALIDILEYTLIPPLCTLALESNSVEDYQTRLGARDTPFVGELYHENSKLNEYNIRSIITDEVLVRDVKEWYLTTACNIQDDDIDIENQTGFFRRLDAFSLFTRTLLAGLRNREGTLLLFYSFDLLILDGDHLYRFLPGKDYLILQKSVPHSEREMLISWILQKPTPCSDDVLFFVIGAPWRNMVLYGQRGYRQMLFDVGYFLNVIQSLGKTQRIIVNVYTLFYDNKVNALLNLDGVERYVLGVLSIPGK